MPRSLPKKPAGRGGKITAVAPAAPVGRILEMRPVAGTKHHGLPSFCAILIFLVIGCLAAAFLMSEKLKTTLAYADGAAARLAASEEQKAELAEQLSNIKTLNNLAAKISPPAVDLSAVAWETYASTNLSLQYPRGYAVVKAVSGFPALTIKNNKGRIEIFRMKDFPGGARQVGAGGESLPKEALLVGTALEDSRIQPYDAWLYYETGDDATKAELKAIAASVKALR